MNAKKGFLALLAGIVTAAVTAVSVQAVGLGFSNGYVPFKVTGTQEYTAFRELDDFSWKGDMIAVAAVKGDSLSQGTYYFHIEPVMDDDMMTLFRRQYKWYKGMYLSNAEIVDIDFWDADGNAVTPKADIYFQSYDRTMPYDCVFMYENGRFVPATSSRMIDTLKFTAPHNARYVLADYTFTHTTTGDTDPAPVDVSSKTDDGKEFSRPVPQESSEQETSGYLPNSSTVEVSEISDVPDSEPTGRDESKEDEPSSETSWKDISIPESSEIDISVPESSSEDSSTSESSSGTIAVSSNDTTSSGTSAVSQGNISAPDGTAATGDSSTAPILAVMSIVAGTTVLLTCRKKKSQP